jgi:hypothetical protein
MTMRAPNARPTSWGDTFETRRVVTPYLTDCICGSRQPLGLRDSS